MKNRIISLIIVVTIMLLQVNIITQATGEALKVVLSPENYASVHVTKDGYSEHEKYAKTLGVYYNTLYDKSVYAEFGSFISSYRVPFADELTSMNISYYVTKGGMQTGRTIPVIYDFEKFSLDADNGYYSQDTEQYNSAISYAQKYWPADNKYGYKGDKLAVSILETESGLKTYDVTSTAMKAFADESNTSEYITFATGRETDKYANGSFAHTTEERIPKLTLTYSKEQILNKINTAQRADMSNLLDKLSAAQILANTQMGANSYLTLIPSAKEYVENKLYEMVSNGGFSDLEAFYDAYDVNTEYAITNGVLFNVNSVTSADKMGEIINELGMSGTFNDTQYGYNDYTALNDGMKEYVNQTLYDIVLNGGFADLEEVAFEYNKAVKYVSEITADVLPENFATIHITRDGYSEHKKYAKKLFAYYNTVYYGITYAEFGSLITGYRLPFKNSIKNIGIKYYVQKGGMQTGRTIPVFYDYNMFSINAEAGSYQGPVAATDTTDAVDASKEYSDILAYTSNYWPANGKYSYSQTPFANQLAHNILETSTGTKTYDVTDRVLDGLLKRDTDSITFATGRETSEYANGSFDVSTDERVPKLAVVYDAVSVIERINAVNENEVSKLIDDLGKSGILDNGLNGYDVYKNMTASDKAKVCKKIYSVIENGGFKTYKEFIDFYDSAVIIEETGILDISIYDETKEYVTAKDAQGKAVTVKASVLLDEQHKNYTAVLAEYNGDKLISAVSSDVMGSDNHILFAKTLASDTTELTIMVFDSITGLKPVCRAVDDRFKVLDGKKVLFIGNSHTYRGMTVIEKDLDILDQESRSHDTGYFYQLCKANGCDVEVTNWTFSGHGLGNITGGNPCTYNSYCKGKTHMDYLTDRYFDYVFIQSARGANSEKTFMDDFIRTMGIFKNANPDVKIVCLGTASSRGINQDNDTAYTGVTDSYKILEDMGVIIADWGEVVAGIINEKYIVPDSKHDYTRSSFIVSDNYHTNALAGYITTLTAYCAVTGEKALGQPYEFYNDTTLNSKFNMLNYINKYYTNGVSDTNFHEIFTSESDIRGIQQLVDNNLKTKPYLYE